MHHEIVKKCPACSIFLNCQSSEPIINHPIANQSWTKIAVDLFHMYRHYSVLTFDYYCKFIVIEMLKSLQSSTVPNIGKKSFSQFGTPTG